MKRPLMRKSQYSVAGESYRDVQSTAVRSIPAWCFPRVSDVTDSALITILLHVELDVSVLVKLAIVSWNRYVIFPRTIYLRGIFPFVVFGLLLVVVGLSMNEYSCLLCHIYWRATLDETMLISLRGIDDFTLYFTQLWLYASFKLRPNKIHTDWY